MNPHLEWPEIALRLILTLVAGALIGINREEDGHAAGFRTNMLVCLAAAGAMLLANFLLRTSLALPEVLTVRLDFMRLPLGILTGVGFIGAGAIIHRGNMVSGVTTAATLWFVTVMGLCFGAGDYGLGLALLGLGLFVLWGLKWTERFWQRHTGVLRILSGPDGPTEGEVREMITASGRRIKTLGVQFARDKGWWEWRAEIYGYGPIRSSKHIPELVEMLAKQPGVQEIGWEPAR